MNNINKQKYESHDNIEMLLKNNANRFIIQMMQRITMPRNMSSRRYKLNWYCSNSSNFRKCL